MAELIINCVSETYNFCAVKGTATNKQTNDKTQFTHNFKMELEFLAAGDFSKYLNDDGSPKDELIVKDIFSGLIKIRII